MRQSNVHCIAMSWKYHVHSVQQQQQQQAAHSRTVKDLSLSLCLYSAFLARSYTCTRSPISFIIRCLNFIFMLIEQLRAGLNRKFCMFLCWTVWQKSVHGCVCVFEAAYRVLVGCCYHHLSYVHVTIVSSETIYALLDRDHVQLSLTMRINCGIAI